MTAKLRHPLLVPLALILVVGAGLLLWRVRIIDQRLRDDLLLHARLVARAVNPTDVAGFAGMDEDLASPLYQRLKEHLRQARSLDPKCRFLYLMGRRADGTVFFLVDSEAPGAAGYSPPGQAYGEATALLGNVFQSGEAEVEGPVHDRWGTWISALLPIKDPRSGQILAVLGMDVEAATWRSLVLSEALPTTLTVFAIFLIVLAGVALLRRRERLSPNGAVGPMRHIEVALAASIGLAATCDWVFVAHDTEKRQNWETFCRLAASGIDALSGALSSIRTSELEGLSRLFDASDFVGRLEFSNYADFLARSPLAQAWEWVPAVRAEDKDSFEQSVRGGGAPGFAIWQKDEAGQRISATGRDMYFPVCYVSPLVGNEAALGFDQGSDPVRHAALDTALRTGLMTASDPVSLVQGAMGDRGILVFRPVISRVFPGRLDGFAVVVLRMQVLLHRALGTLVSDHPVDVEVQQLRTEATPVFLGTTAPLAVRDSDLILRAPVFAFGKTYAVICRPSPEFPRLYPPVAAWYAAVAGALLTALICTLIGFHRNRQITLERLVRARTEELRESGARLNEAQRMARIGNWDLDLRTKQLTWSGEVHRIFNVEPSTLGATYEDFLQAIHPDDREAVDQAYAESVRSRSPFDITHRIQPADGAAKFVQVRGETFYDARGNPLRSAGTVQDMTDMKQAEAEREHLQGQLLQAQKMESIGRLAGGVAHDFNNMLQVIIGNATLALEESSASSTMREYLEEIQKSAGRSADLARQLLAFASRQTASPRILDLNGTVSGMLKMLRRLIGEDIQLHWTPGPDVWPVKMDPSQIDQILANLAVNARDAIGGVGQITIDTVNVTCDDVCRRDYPGCTEGEFVQLAVRDNGCGMDAATREHIFEPFFTTKGNGQGTGLGLATVFGIVKQNKGHIAVETAPGQGTTFRLLLPRVAAPADGRAAPAGPALVTLSGAECLLMVEDEKSILNLGKTVLERLGYTVLTANSPAEAITRATEYAGHIDLLITDVVLPEMNGRDLARRLSTIKPKMKCLFMSGYTADVIANRGVLDEDVLFIQNPFSVEALSAKVREVLEAPPHA